MSEKEIEDKLNALDSQSKEDDGKYCVDLKGENYSVYFAGEPTPSGLTPMFRYDFTFDKNTNKLYRTTITLVSMT